jgi:hypothetical protein
VRSIIFVLDHGGDMVMCVLSKFRRLKKSLNISCVGLIFSVFICMICKLQSNESMLVTGAVKFQWCKISL